MQSRILAPLEALLPRGLPAATVVSLATYGVMGAAGFALSRGERTKSLGSSVMIASGVGVVFTLASFAIEKLALPERLERRTSPSLAL